MKDRRAPSAKRMANNDLFSNAMRYALCAIANGVRRWKAELQQT